LGLQSCGEAKEGVSVGRLTYNPDAVLAFQKSFQAEQEKGMVISKQDRDLVGMKVQRASSGLWGIFSPKPHRIAPFVLVRQTPINLAVKALVLSLLPSFAMTVTRLKPSPHCHPTPRLSQEFKALFMQC